MNKTKALWFRWAPCLYLLAALTAAAQTELPLPPPIPAHAISFWPLEAPPWESSSDKPARAFTNLNAVPSWDYAGTALSVDTNVSAFLQLDVFESGKTNMTFNSGSLEIWCQANWTSVADGGIGPGAWATLWDVGAFTRNASIGAWLLTINPAGSNLLWLAQAGGSNQVLSAGIDFDAGDWHQIVATWSATNACLYMDGELITNSGPILYQPSSLECSNDGFCVGSLSASGTNAGTNQFHGQLQWLASYAEPLSADDVAGRFTDVADYIANFGYNAPGAGGFHSDDDPILPEGGGTNSGGSGGGPEFVTFTPPAPISATDYVAYNELYLTVTNDSTNAYVTVCNTLSNLTYKVLTNSSLDNTNWGLWQTFLATNSITPAPPIALSSNAPLFFRAQLVWSTCTNYSPPLPDWWMQEYFSSTACVDPNANPSGDGIDNWDKYILGLSPNISYVSQILFNPPGGNFINTPTVTIFSLNGASIIYTTNGSLPSPTNGIAITSGVSITNLPTGNFTLKAIESGSTSNIPTVATYTIIPATPTFSLPSGVYVAGTMLQISCATPTAAIYYTTNGNDPTTSSFPVTTNCLLLETNVTVKAAAWLGTNISPVTDAGYIIDGPPANDDFSNATVLSGLSGQFSGTTLASTVESFETNDAGYIFDYAAYYGNSVWYKWTAPSNGTVFLDYSKCNPAYEDAISVYCFSTNSISQNPTNLIEVGVSYDSDYTSETFVASNDVAYFFSISGYVPGPFQISWEYAGLTDRPFFTPGAGTYLSAELVTVSDNDTNAVIYYTLDGSDPATNSSTILSGSTLLVNTNETLKAAAWRAGLDESAITVATYTINPGSTNPTLTASAPFISPTNEDFASSLTVTLACTNTGGIIYYTLDGSEPTVDSASVMSGGTVTISNSAIVNAVTWVTNLNLSSVTTGEFAKDGVDTAGDGIPDTGKLQIGVDILIPEAPNVNPNPFAHGLDNLQVYENPSVLTANNYSTENDGIPDWWLVQNGYSVTTSAAALGANGQMLLTCYVAGLNPNNPNSQPGETPPIDFHMVHGPSNSLIMSLDTVRPGMASYVLLGTQVDPNSAGYSQTVLEAFSADDSRDAPTNGYGRYFQLTNQLWPGDWQFSLMGYNSNGLRSATSSNTFEKINELMTYYGFNPPTLSASATLEVGASVAVANHTNDFLTRESALIQMIRAESSMWFPYTSLLDTVNFDSAGQTPTIALYADGIQANFEPEESWGTASFLFDTNLSGLNGQDWYGYSVNGPCLNLISITNYLAPTAFINVAPEIFNIIYDDDFYYSVLGTFVVLDRYSDGQPFFLMAYDNYWDLEVYPGGYFIPAPDQLPYKYNPAGLEYLSSTYQQYGSSPITLTPGQLQEVPNSNFLFDVSFKTETPTLLATNYLFDGRDYPLQNWNYYDTVSSYRSSPPPGPSQDFFYDGWFCNRQVAFPVATTNPVIVAQVGKPVHLQGWSEVLAVTAEGQVMTNTSYFLDQDFAQAYLCNPSTGDVSRTSQTNSDGKFKIDTNAAMTTGILSSTISFTNVTASGSNWPSTQTAVCRGADFTPTQPGKVIVTTVPDANGNYGEVTIYVIDMQVDANHDGVMDNRDLTSVNNPMKFWINNDIDRWHTVDVTDSEQDDLLINDSSLQSWQQVPDSQYADSISRPAIPCTRDLEDYTRLWIPGLSSLMQELPTGYGVNLVWRNNTGAGIRVFEAAEEDGGTNYLFDGTTSSNQVNESEYPCIGYATSNQSISINNAFTNFPYGSSPPGDHYIFCGTSVGSDELVLQITNQWGGEVGEASVFLNLKDIKQMYERWSVGEDPSQPPNNIATNCGDGGVASFEYPYDSTTDINTPYILHVHGSNMATWEKDRFAETMYKRLYWQGYQGRFGSFRWPTSWGFNGSYYDIATDSAHFDIIEYTAWTSAQGLGALLRRNNLLYPGHAMLSAHSMGNIAASEALRQATNVVVKVYTAFQSAGPAQAYDPSAATLSLGSFEIGEPNAYLHYYSNNSPCYFSGSLGASTYVNFFNTNDFVLNQWFLGQQLKPDVSLDYAYNSGQFEIEPGGRVLSFPGDTYEIFAFCLQARCNCIGEYPGLGGLFNPGLEVDLGQPPYNFGNTHKFHSGEFRSDNMQRWQFWNQLLKTDSLNSP